MNREEALDYYTDQDSYDDVLDNDDLGRGEAMESAFKAAWALAKASGPRSPRNFVDLAKKVDEGEGAERAMARIQLVKAILEGDINDDTSVVGMGPVNLDVSMARAHHWSKEQIDRAWSVLEAVATAEGRIAHLRHPGLFKDDGDGNSVMAEGDKQSECSGCGREFEFCTEAPAQDPLKPNVRMLLGPDGVHAGFVVMGDGPDGEPEILCWSCGFEVPE